LNGKYIKSSFYGMKVSPECNCIL